MTLTLGICGAEGRMGRAVLALLPEYPELRLTAALTAHDSPGVGRLVSGVRLAGRAADVSGEAEVWLDFSAPDSSVMLAEECARRGRPLLVGTTGHSNAEREALLNSARRIPLALVANTSIGVFALLAAAREAQRILGSSAEVEIVEAHHRAKKDTPSGTALMIARELGAAGGLTLITSREGERKPGELGVTSIRGGDVVGEHTVYFLGDGERLELTHRARDRSVFARGALQLVQRLARRTPGLYGISDLVGAEQ